MPESIPDYSAHIATLERKLRALKRNIIGTADAGRTALENSESAPLFEARFEYVQQDWEDFKKIWNELDEVSSAAGVQFPSKTWQEIFDTSRDEIYQSRSLLLQIERLRARAEHPPTPPNENRQSLNMSLPSTSKSHLPRISLPQFSGDVFKWTHFRDTFSSMVHNETTLTKVEKFHYLLRSLDGEAASLIARFPVEENSYDQAWGKLCENYNNPRVLASLFLQQIIEGDFKGMRSELERYSHFMTSVADSIEGFRSLKLEDPCEFLLASLALRALDPQTRRNFELSRKNVREFPTADEVIGFVRQRKVAITMSRDFSLASPVMESKALRKSTNVQFPRRRSPRFRFKNGAMNLHTAASSRGHSPPTAHSSGQATPASKPRKGNPSPPNRPREGGQNKPKLLQTCPFCEGNHLLPRCYSFSDSPRAQRTDFINSLKYCRNCLRPGHSVTNCPSKWNCRFCNQRHHSLLHEETKSPSNSSLFCTPQSRRAHEKTLGSKAVQSTTHCHALLGTAEVLVVGRDGELHPLRAILDSGSQHTFVTQRAIHRTGLPVKRYQGNITGLGGITVAKPVGTAQCEMRTRNGSRCFKTHALVVDDITPPIPSSPILRYKSQKLHRYELADKNFHAPGAVDMLIGVDLYPSVVTGAPLHSGVDSLFFLPTVFGMVVIGAFDDTPHSSSTVLFSESQSTIEANLKAFWELEEPQAADRRDPDDQKCEDHFITTTSRTPEGRYVVRLPLTMSGESLGRNRDVVTKRFLNLERKLQGNQRLSKQYHAFMQEYQLLEHLSPATTKSDYLIPHHGIWQEHHSGDKLRVVFDASCKASNEISLNSILMTGPKLQADIGNVLMNFRLFSIPLCADLVKMYRQILIHPQDRHLQHILWRDSPGGAISEMELNTVTYGLRSSAFQAQRVIKQLVRDEGENYPLAVRAISTSMYIDDIVTGANTVEEAKELQRQLVTLFAKGGFSLAKWASSISELIPTSENVEPLQLNSCDSGSVKILGLIWNPISDTLSYAVSPPPMSHITKRTILSAIARIFDPLGLVAPIVILVKILIQSIWKHQLDWDQHLPPEIEREWRLITQEWSRIPEISVPRIISSNQSSRQIIGFCDASSKAYAAAVYLRSEDPSGLVRSTLIKAKTKVAPLKYTSVARLELCGALLLTRLLTSITFNEMETYPRSCYTDSTVVLSWIRIPTHQLKVFEANRVSEILSCTAPSAWRHVNSEENPADVASRGCLPSALSTHDLWWHGPAWLLQPLEFWPQPPHVNLINSSCSPHSNSLVTAPQVSDEIIKRFSEYQTLIRTVARILRLLTIVRPPRRRMNGPITAEEYREAKYKCVKITQEKLDHQQHRQLSPFLDEQGIIRVGGRIQFAPLPASSKHPILLPRNSHLSLLVIRDIHRRHYHSGPSLTLAILRCEFWVPRALRKIREVINQCIHCRIQRGQPVQPMMAPLPKERFSHERAFLHVGLDYAGPFIIKQGNTRKSPLSKAYLCLFVCMSTKAVHLEAVSSLTTEAFLAALDRFASRRGLPRLLWSDRGTNFVGASRYLKDVYQFLQRNENELSAWSAPRNIEWRFNPPHAPHFGGLWEAGVKSAKTLLASVLNSQPHTFEELMTIFTRIEQMLNSRPLCALSEDPENCNFLTPAHFLIGDSLASIPEAANEPSLKAPKNRWETTQARIQHMWERWKREYLHTLQQRTKWTTPTSNIYPGQLVVLTERRNAVGQWPVGRVIKVHPGEDGITRTATIRTPSNQTYIRPVVSLVPLLPPDEDSTNREAQQ